MIKVMQADVTILAVDAIVNAANELMLGNAPPRPTIASASLVVSEEMSVARAD